MVVEKDSSAQFSYLIKTRKPQGTCMIIKIARMYKSYLSGTISWHIYLENIFEAAILWCGPKYLGCTLAAHGTTRQAVGLFQMLENALDARYF
jgi:hypothetical protein